MTVAFLHDRASARPVPIGSRTCTVTGIRRRGTARRTTITARGDIDAANAKQFADSVCALLPRGAATLDLTGVQFIAVDAIAALHAINAHMARSGAAWQVLPSRAVRRVLDLCDPVGLIPRTVDERAHGATA